MQNYYAYTTINAAQQILDRPTDILQLLNDFSVYIEKYSGIICNINQAAVGVFEIFDRKVFRV